MESGKGDFMISKKLVIVYLFMLTFHVAHVFEEIWGRFWILDHVGPGLYLIINWFLFCIPVLLFYFVLNKKKWAYKLSLVYAAFMALQGVGHNIATLISGRYFDGFAGGYTGIGLFIAGLFLMYYLLKEIRTKQRR